MHLNNKILIAINKGINEALALFDLDDFNFNDEVKDTDIVLDHAKGSSIAKEKIAVLTEASKIQDIILRVIEHDTITSADKRFFTIHIKECLPYIKKVRVFNDNISTFIRTTIKVLGNKCNLNWIDTSEVTDMSFLFAFTKFNGDISEWNTSNVTDMSKMFKSSVFNGDISKWDVSKVANMRGMFTENKVFNQDISTWDISSVQICTEMFMKASAFKQDLSKWKFSIPLPWRDSMFWMSGLTDTKKWPCNYFA